MITGIKRRKINVFTAPDCNGMIRKLNTGEYRLYHRRKAGKNIVRKSIGTYSSLAIAKKYEQEI